MAASSRTIQCSDCGLDYETKRPNTKYCAVCRLFRDLMYIGARKRKCLVCDERFALLTTAEKLCSKCDVLRPAGRVDGECAFCRTATYPLLCADVAVCTLCARDPAQRDLLIKAVAQKRNARMVVTA